MPMFRISIYWADPDEMTQHHLLGTVTIEANNVWIAKQDAMDILWDERLNACAIIEVEEIEAEKEEECHELLDPT